MAISLAAGNLAERIVHQTMATTDVVRPDTEMYLAIGAIISHTDVQDEYQAADHSQTVTYRLGRTGGGRVVAVLHSVAGDALPASEAGPVFDPTSPAAQTLMTRNFLQRLFAYFGEGNPYDAPYIVPVVQSADFHSTLASSAAVPPPMALMPGGATWGGPVSSMRTRLGRVDAAAAAGDEEVKWDRRIEQLASALVPLVQTMVGAYECLCPGVRFGPAQG